MANPKKPTTPKKKVNGSRKAKSGKFKEVIKVHGTFDELIAGALGLKVKKPK